MFINLHAITQKKWKKRVETKKGWIDATQVGAGLGDGGKMQKTVLSQGLKILLVLLILVNFESEISKASLLNTSKSAGLYQIKAMSQLHFLKPHLYFLLFVLVLHKVFTLCEQVQRLGEKEITKLKTSPRNKKPLNDVASC